MRRLRPAGRTFRRNINQAKKRGGCASVDGDGAADLSTFYNGFVVEQIGDGGAVLVDIADGEAEALGDTSTGGNTEHEKPAVACLESAVKAFCDFSDFVSV